MLAAICNACCAPVRNAKSRDTTIASKFPVLKLFLDTLKSFRKVSNSNYLFDHANQVRDASMSLDAVILRLLLCETADVTIHTCAVLGTSYLFIDFIIVFLVSFGYALALLSLMVAKLAKPDFFAALVALDPSLLTVVIKVRTVRIQAQPCLSTLIDAGKSCISQHTLHGLAAIAEV